MFNHYKAIKSETERWSVGDYPATIVNLMALSNAESLVINEGGAGLSKSRISSELARYLNLATETRDEQGLFTAPTVVFNGNLSAKGFYTFIKQYSDKVIIFDDITTLTKQQLGILKDVCGENRSTQWWTSLDEEEDKFTFTGSVIINSNTDSNKKNYDLDAIKSRGFVNHFYVKPLEIQAKKKEYWNTIVNHKEPNIEVWRIIRERMLNHTPAELTKKELVEIRSFVESVAIYHETKTSMRDDINTLHFFRWWKGFWGEMNDTLMKDGIEIMRSFYCGGGSKKISRVKETVLEYTQLHNTGVVRRQALAHTLSTKYGYSLRTAQREIDNSIFGREIENGDNERCLQLKQEMVKSRTVIETF
jgi:hypothetical protein